MARNKSDLIRAISYSKLPMKEIETRLSKSRFAPSFDRLLSSDSLDRPKIPRRGELEGAKSLFSLERLRELDTRKT